MNACGSAIGGRLVHKANRLNGKSGFPARASRFLIDSAAEARAVDSRPTGTYNKCGFMSYGALFPDGLEESEYEAAQQI